MQPDIGPEHQETARIFVLEQGVKRFFPDFKIDREEYDRYNPKKDPYDRGQILHFYTEKEKRKLILILCLFFAPRDLL